MGLLKYTPVAGLDFLNDSSCVVTFGVRHPLSSGVGGPKKKKKKIMRSGVQGSFQISDVVVASWLATLAC